MGGSGWDLRDDRLLELRTEQLRRTRHRRSRVFGDRRVPIVAVGELDVAQVQEAGDDGKQLVNLLLVEAAVEQGVEQDAKVSHVIDQLCSDAPRLPQQREVFRLQAAELHCRPLRAVCPRQHLA